MIADYMEPITGYRAWNVHHNGLLIGQNHAEPWPPYTPFVARCGHAVSPHHIREGQWIEAPLISCHCGIYAFNNTVMLEERIQADKNSLIFGINNTGEDAMVWGEVKLWGRVIVHQSGYRAEFAYPGELWCEDEKLCAKVASLYGVSCRLKAVDRPETSIYDYGRIFGSLPVTYKFWGNTPPSNPVPTPAQAPFLHAPSFAQIKVIGATPWQQRQAQMWAKQIPMLAQDWREMWRDGFKMKKSINPTPAQMAYASVRGGGKSAFMQSLRQTYLAATQGLQLP